MASRSSFPVASDTPSSNFSATMPNNSINNNNHSNESASNVNQNSGPGPGPGSTDANANASTNANANANSNPNSNDSSSAQFTTFLQAAELLYNASTDPNTRRNADNWIVEFQKGEEAWMIADQVLRSPTADAPGLHSEDGIQNSSSNNNGITTTGAAPSSSSDALSATTGDGQFKASTHAKFLAAQTMNRKVRYDFEQLPRESLPSLRDSLCDLIMSVHSSLPSKSQQQQQDQQQDQNQNQNQNQHQGQGRDWGNATTSMTTDRSQSQQSQVAIGTQLCLALVALAVQMHDWDQVFSDIIARFSSDTRLLPPLLQVLQLIPEECDNPVLDVSPQRRAYFVSQMLDSSEIVSDVMRQTLQLRPEDVGISGRGSHVLRRKVLDCLGSWVSKGALSASQLVNKGLLNVALETLSNSNNTDFNAAVTTTIEIVHQFNSLEPDDLTVVRVLLPGIFGLKTAYLRSVENEDEDVSIGLCRLFAHTGEAFADILVGSDDVNQVELVSLILLGTSHQSREVASHTIPFWLKFMNLLARIPSDEQRERLMKHFAPTLNSLLDVCMYQARYPTDFHEFDEEDRDKFHDHRQDLSEILDQLCYVGPGNQLGVSVLPVVAQRIREGYESYRSDSTTWNVFEAAIFTLRSIADEIAWSDPGTEVGDTLRSTLSLLLSVEDAHFRVLRGIISLLGELTAFYPRNDDYFMPAVQYAAKKLLVPNTAASSARTIKLFCMECRKLFVSSNSGLELYQNLVSLCQQPNIELKDRLVAVEGLASVVSTLSHEHAVQAINALARPAVQLLTQVTSDGSQQNLSALAVENSLDMLTSITRSARLRDYPTNLQHPSVSVLQEVWGGLEACAHYYGNVDRVVEAICRLIKHTVRSSREHYKPMVQRTLSFLVQAFQRYPSSPYMYAGGVIASEYYDHEELLPLFPPMLNAFAEKTFSIIDTNEAFIGNPEFVEDLFLLGNKFVEFCPQIISQMDLLKTLFRAGSTVGLTVEHPQASRAVLRFLESVLRLAVPAPNAANPELANRIAVEYQPVVNECFSENGEALLFGLSAGISGAVAENRTADYNSGSFGLVLLAIARFIGSPDTFAEALRLSLQNNEKCSHVNNEFRRWIVEHLVEALDHGESEFLDIVREWNEKARKKLTRKI